MTEREWLTCADPKSMLEFLRGKASERKLRLFKCACCRRIWHFLTHDRCRKAIEAIEAFADGELSTEYFEEASQGVSATYYELIDSLKETGTTRSLQATLFAANAVCCAMIDAYPRYNLDTCSYAASTSEAIGDAIGHSTACISQYTQKKAEELKGHAMLLRDIMGNPFHPVNLEPTWLSSTVKDQARSTYNDWAFDRMPILAESLEDAGCSSQDILNHCRQPGEHVKGCWALDLILDKK